MDVDSSITMHCTCCNSLSQLCCRFGIQLSVSSFPLFGRITVSLCFTCLRGLYVFLLIHSLVLLHNWFLEQRLLNYYLQEGTGLLLRMSPTVEITKSLFKHQVVDVDGEKILWIKLECWVHGGWLYKSFFLNTLSPYLFYLITIITHAAGLSKFLGNIRSLEVVYNAEEEDYFTGGVMGITKMVHHKM